ncbi:MAG: hypothetical protein EOP17_08085 [Rhizobiaceae bacterium]|nr:MAG: hypothetical protein EOP17_08085 [Rhizobiaceae bacterium]
MAAALALLGAAPPHAYSEGQVWEYRNRTVDAGSLLRIQKIEHIEIAGRDEEIFHLSVIGLRFSGTPFGDQVIQHIEVAGLV